MELFDKKFVYLEWDPILEGKKVFVADCLADLRKRVITDDRRFFGCIVDSGFHYTFQAPDGLNYALCYYDPNYECKRAYMEGKEIQARGKGSSDESDWYDVDRPNWLDCQEYRVKPEETYRVAFKKSSRCMVCGPAENILDSDNHHVLFEGTEDECGKYMRQKVRFNLVMGAYYCDGKTIQGRTKLLSDPWTDCIGDPRWFDACEYRVKPDRKRRMTNWELAKWVAQGNGQVKNIDENCISSRGMMYYEKDEQKTCGRYIQIRGWDETEWHEPLVEED